MELSDIYIVSVATDVVRQSMFVLFVVYALYITADFVPCTHLCACTMVVEHHTDAELYQFLVQFANHFGIPGKIIFVAVNKFDKFEISSTTDSDTRNPVILQCKMK